MAEKVEQDPNRLYLRDLIRINTGIPSTLEFPSSYTSSEIFKKGLHDDALILKHEDMLEKYNKDYTKIANTFLSLVEGKMTELALEISELMERED